MELKLYLKALKKYAIFIAATSLTGIIIALGFASSLPEGYRQTQVFYIASDIDSNLIQSTLEPYSERKNSVLQDGDEASSQTRQATFDVANLEQGRENHGLQAVGIYYAQETARNFTDTAIAILSSHDYKTTILAPGQTLTVRKLAPQVIQVTATAAGAQETSQLIAKAIGNFNRQFTELHPVGQAQEPKFAAAGKKILAAAGLVLGFTFAFFVVSLKEYFRI